MLSFRVASANKVQCCLCSFHRNLLACLSNTQASFRRAVVYAEIGMNNPIIQPIIILEKEVHDEDKYEDYGIHNGSKSELL